MNAKAWVSVGAAAALLIAGVVMIVFSEERDMGKWLIVTAAAAAGIPALADSVKKKPQEPTE